MGRISAAGSGGGGGNGRLVHAQVIVAGADIGPVTPRGRSAAVLAGILRFLGLWAGISGAYATIGGACPCCGQPGCPVGIGSAAILGALGSFVVLKGRALVARLRRKPDG